MSKFKREIDVLRVLEIKDIIVENKTVKTFIFDWDFKNKEIIPSPGQFMMIWNFNDEKPMSISRIDSKNNQIAISVKNIGKFTGELHSLEIGDKLGLRGPYGNGFTLGEERNNKEIQNTNILLIGGGIGTAPLLGFTDYALKKGANVDFISAAVDVDELLFVDTIKKYGANVYTCTDNGSCGFKGFAVDRVKDLLENNSYDLAYTCGPEIMMEGIIKLMLDKNIPLQVSMERYMKCALGLCGQCCVDDVGWRICVEGPVFKNEQIKKITEFSKYHRDSSGTKIYY